MMNARRQKGKAGRGLRTLIVAVAFPITLTFLDIFLFGFKQPSATTFSFPPLWALHSSSLVAAFLSGLSAWLIWAEGGFHRHPHTFAVFSAHLFLGFAWYPLVLGFEAARLGLALCAAVVALMSSSARMFADMNPIAGDLLKLALVCPVLQSLFNFRFVYHVYDVV